MKNGEEVEAFFNVKIKAEIVSRHASAAKEAVESPWQVAVELARERVCLSRRNRGESAWASHAFLGSLLRSRGSAPSGPSLPREDWSGPSDQPQPLPQHHEEI